ncbi:hypothetical protein FS935_19360 [Metabacillus litoralis]|uniref:Uncharacterized protein n=1 Tax=Metabacillus litoralis TaxID=152268 RepID=A0A5C6VQ01_9BACI|nr:hypothetical protein [Metabacillus litoralis]TXC85815.1 hypothetical protein FS935_19360 [Metabacillus litoralis]
MDHSTNENEIKKMAEWLKGNVIEVVEGSVNKEIIRYNLRMEFDVTDDVLVDKVYEEIAFH